MYEFYTCSKLSNKLSLTGRQCEDGGEVSDPTPGRRDTLPDHHTPDLCGQRRQEGDLGE